MPKNTRLPLKEIAQRLILRSELTSIEAMAADINAMLFWDVYRDNIGEDHQDPHPGWYTVTQNFDLHMWSNRIELSFCGSLHNYGREFTHRPWSRAMNVVRDRLLVRDCSVKHWRACSPSRRGTDSNSWFQFRILCPVDAPKDIELWGRSGDSRWISLEAVRSIWRVMTYLAALQSEDIGWGKSNQRESSSKHVRHVSSSERNSRHRKLLSQASNSSH